ncbi:hypothetical protein SCHPADRAFT_889521 [Schizopora paradoxa]|uniref:Uncharacterized protein n=1 Tax=Schizopora paradoxa TaxID=27342 RepID=A0A0H2RQL7_9AGAM|nr:hypothetical protein SCHPADRAFT_889521 [Schizopora paradoxa]
MHPLRAHGKHPITGEVSHADPPIESHAVACPSERISVVNLNMRTVRQCQRRFSPITTTSISPIDRQRIAIQFQQICSTGEEVLVGAFVLSRSTITFAEVLLRACANANTNANTLIRVLSLRLLLFTSQRPPLIPIVNRSSTFASRTSPSNMTDRNNINIQQLRDARILVDSNPEEAFQLALNKSAVHSKVLARCIQTIPEHIAVKVVGMFANEIQHTDFQTATTESGQLVVDNRRFDALYAMANVGSPFFAKYHQAKNDVLAAIPAVEKLLRLALDSLINNTLRPSRRLSMLKIVRDAISSTRDVGDEGRAYLGRHNYWRPLISVWLTVEPSDPEADSILSRLLVAADHIFGGEKDSNRDKFIPQVFEKATGENTASKATHILRVALGRICRAMPDFNANGDNSTLYPSLHVLFLLYETDDADITAFEHSLRDAFVNFDGVQNVEEILRTGMEYSSWDTVSTTIGIVFRHFCAVASSTTMTRSMDIGLVKTVVETWKAFDNLDPIAQFSISCLVQEYMPQTFAFRSVVNAFKVDELRSSLADVTDQGWPWRNVLLVHDARKSLYKALVRKNGKEQIPCANERTPGSSFQNLCEVPIEVLLHEGLPKTLVVRARTSFGMIAHDDAQYFLDQGGPLPSSQQAIFVAYSYAVLPAVSIADNIQVPETSILPDLQFHYEDNFPCRILVSFAMLLDMKLHAPLRMNKVNLPQHKLMLLVLADGKPFILSLKDFADGAAIDPKLRCHVFLQRDRIRPGVPTDFPLFSPRQALPSVRRYVDGGGARYLPRPGTRLGRAGLFWGMVTHGGRMGYDFGRSGCEPRPQSKDEEYDQD